MLRQSIYSNFKPTCLYIKRHSVTGLKYFGKTTRDPLKYRGSGKEWKQHFTEHGKKFIETLWVSKLFTDPDDIYEFATFVSEELDIVNSPEWANSKVENGLDGGSQTVGMRTMKHIVTGEIRSLHKDDPLLLSDDWVGVAKGNKHPGNNKNKAVAKCVSTGEIFQTDRDDPRFQTGEIVGVTKGKRYKHKKPRTPEHSAKISASKKGTPLPTKGRTSPLKGKSYAEIHGVEKAEEQKARLSRPFVSLITTKKTYTKMPAMRLFPELFNE